jgi:hypothetical protein
MFCAVFIVDIDYFEGVRAAMLDAHIDVPLSELT